MCTQQVIAPTGLMNTNITDEECGRATNLYYYTLVDIVKVGGGGRLWQFQGGVLARDCTQNITNR